MISKDIIKTITVEIDMDKLNRLGIYELRNLARFLGVARPIVNYQRAELIDKIREKNHSGKVELMPRDIDFTEGK